MSILVDKQKKLHVSECLSIVLIFQFISELILFHFWKVLDKPCILSTFVHCCFGTVPDMSGASVPLLRAFLCKSSACFFASVSFLPLYCVRKSRYCGTLIPLSSESDILKSSLPDMLLSSRIVSLSLSEGASYETFDGVASGDLQNKQSIALASYVVFGTCFTCLRLIVMQLGFLEIGVDGESKRCLFRGEYNMLDSISQ